mmetsp:Transcript_19559/g.24655  ORF Transcript_19559/g.24655 Transcript_19559/m.24655 type:complete len:217 (+) Transcript_19559:2763-3413(+)
MFSIFLYETIFKGGGDGSLSCSGASSHPKSSTLLSECCVTSFSWEMACFLRFSIRSGRTLNDMWWGGVESLCAKHSHIDCGWINQTLARSCWRWLSWWELFAFWTGHSWARSCCFNRGGVGNNWWHAGACPHISLVGIWAERHCSTVSSAAEYVDDGQENTNSYTHWHALVDNPVILFIFCCLFVKMSSFLSRIILNRERSVTVFATHVSISSSDN